MKKENRIWLFTGILVLITAIALYFAPHRPAIIKKLPDWFNAYRNYKD